MNQLNIKFTIHIEIYYIIKADVNHNINVLHAISFKLFIRITGIYKSKLILLQYCLLYSLLQRAH